MVPSVLQRNGHSDAWVGTAIAHAALLESRRKITFEGAWQTMSHQLLSVHPGRV